MLATKLTSRTAIALATKTTTIAVCVVAILISSVVVEEKVRASAPEATTNGKIAYARLGDGNLDDIFAINSDGTDNVRITQDPSFDVSPNWSPDGSEIAFVSNRDGDLDVFVMNADGTGQRNLTNDGAENDAPLWSPDAKRLAYRSDQDGVTSVMVINVDGDDAVQLTDELSKISPHFAWTPDSTAIVFAGERDGIADIFMVSLSDSVTTNITDDPAVDGTFSLSPDGSQIAYASNIAGLFDIYVANSDGSDRKILTRSAENDFWPVWSPDGTRIAFLSDKDCFEDVVATHDRLVQLGKLPRTIQRSVDDCIPNLYIMRSDGTDRQRITQNVTRFFLDQPKWSPDSSFVVFSWHTSLFDESDGIYVVNTADGAVTQVVSALTSGPLDWQPLPSSEGSNRTLVISLSAVAFVTVVFILSMAALLRRRLIR